MPYYTNCHKVCIAPGKYSRTKCKKAFLCKNRVKRVHKKGKRRHCKFGVNKRTGRCLKHKRR